MKVRTILVAAVLSLCITGVAQAKYFNQSLTIEGPGLSSPVEIGDRVFLDRVYGTLLAGGSRVRAERPVTPGPAYELDHVFAIGDNDGAGEALIQQTLYPFASGGPVVRTSRGEHFEMSFGTIRFHRGWYEVPQSVLRRFEEAGLPSTRPGAASGRDPKLAPAAGLRNDPPPPWGWILGASAGLVGAVVFGLGRRRHA